MALDILYRLSLHIVSFFICRQAKNASTSSKCRRCAPNVPIEITSTNAERKSGQRSTRCPNIAISLRLSKKLFLRHFHNSQQSIVQLMRFQPDYKLIRLGRHSLRPTYKEIPFGSRQYHKMYQHNINLSGEIF